MTDQSHTKRSLSDRFILSRQQTAQTTMEAEPSSASDPYQAYLEREILPQHQGSQHSFSMGSIKRMLSKREEAESRLPTRTLHTAPEKVLDAPDLRDDYYLNLLDWSSRGTLSIGLGERVYLYSPSSINELCFREDDYVCSLSFHPTGEQLAVGLSSGKTELYDVQRGTLLRTLRGHSDRVSSSAFTYSALFTGSKDSKILGHDYRTAASTVMRLTGHRGEVCGLKHDSCGLASGSNDNSAFIWDLATGRSRFQLTGHKAAVKALAWCPWQRNLLATGGGTSDQTMRFWNIETGKLINTVNANSQVCALLWNKHEKEILSSHGFSENQLSLWRYPECGKVADYHGHSQRVLHMVMAPDNSTVCTASADETIRFWKVFGGSSSFQEEKWNQQCSLNTKNCGLR